MTSATLPDSPASIRDEPAAPSAYGYLRVPADVPDHEMLCLEQALIAFAESEGWSFAGFFFEFRSGSRAGFNELIAELVRAGAHHVVVPSLRHLAAYTLLQNAMQDRLAIDAGAEVVAMRPDR
ncbi:hypothetical protein [Amycolatopsis sp. NPDC051102]|uniref:hypothetical protein n=1 Tax=Amycolatopsis sp. NPDC051102 TaxID=3155163 RepID=UPI00341530AA